MTTENNYSEFVDAPSIESSRSLSHLIDALHEAEIEVLKAQEELKKCQDTARNLAEQEIPELMARMGVSSFVTSNGLSVSIKDDVRTAIAVANRPDAFKWLDDNGHGGLLKREIAVAFARTEADRASELKDTLEEEYAGNVREDIWIEPQTLKAFVKKQLEAGVKIPVDLFGIQKTKTAKIK